VRSEASFLRRNGLSLVMTGLFLLCWSMQTWAGYRHEQDERGQHGQPPLALAEYVRSGQFWESTAENWESEFLQMAAFIWLTRFLRQRGSPQSKSLDGEDDADREPRARPGAPWPVHRGGLALALYQNSLTIALLGLFLFSFAVHAVAGHGAYNEEQRQHGGAELGVLGYVASSRFWFESMQNWQSEFMSVGTLVVLSVFLRQKGSPESKPVDAAHAENEG
jgi:hypothetical protein